MKDPNFYKYVVLPTSLIIIAKYFLMMFGYTLILSEL